MFISDSFFAVIYMDQGTKRYMVSHHEPESRSWSYCMSPPAGTYTVRAGDSPVHLHNDDGGFVCPPRQDTEIIYRRSPDIGRVSHTFRPVARATV